jgi:hypothetical protein
MNFQENYTYIRNQPKNKEYLNLEDSLKESYKNKIIEKCSKTLHHSTESYINDYRFAQYRKSNIENYTDSNSWKGVL